MGERASFTSEEEIEYQQGKKHLSPGKVQLLDMAEKMADHIYPGEPTQAVDSYVLAFLRTLTTQTRGMEAIIAFEVAHEAAAPRVDAALHEIGRQTDLYDANRTVHIGRLGDYQAIHAQAATRGGAERNFVALFKTNQQGGLVGEIEMFADDNGYAPRPQGKRTLRHLFQPQGIRSLTQFQHKLQRERLLIRGEGMDIVYHRIQRGPSRR